MIHGLIMDVKGEELIEYANARAAHHRKRAEECGTEAETPAPQARTRETLDRKSRQHQERAEALVFFARHLVPDEVYQVSESDLREADLLPERSAFGDWLW